MQQFSQPLLRHSVYTNMQETQPLKTDLSFDIHDTCFNDNGHSPPKKEAIRVNEGISTQKLRFWFCISTEQYSLTSYPKNNNQLNGLGGRNVA